MMSLDPWRVIAIDPYGDVVIPAPVWGHPFYREVPSWIHYGEGDGTQRLLFDGAFIGAAVPDERLEATAMTPYTYAGRSFHPYYAGAEVPPPSSNRGKLTAAIAPVIAPATGGYEVKLALDDKQILHAAICVDGKCYESSIDLAPAIAAIMAKFARYHAELHASTPGHAGVSPTVVVGAINAAVGAAGDGLVEALVDRHITVACGSFLDDIGNFVKGIPVVGDVFKTVGETVNTLKEPLKAAIPIVATAFGGPAGAAAASQFAGPIIDSLAGGKDTTEKKAAEQKAKTDPQTAAGLSSTKQALAHTIAAFHTTETARKAASGDPTAQRHVAHLVRDAERGDPVAHAVTPLVEKGFSMAHAERRGAPESYRHVASRAVAQGLQRYRGSLVAMLGYLRAGASQRVIAFRSPEEAQRWYASISSAPGAYNYAALYDARDLSMPVAESFGGPTM